jgi:hypothetical protein
MLIVSLPLKARIFLASLGELNWLSCLAKVSLAQRDEASKAGKGTKHILNSMFFVIL